MVWAECETTMEYYQSTIFVGWLPHSGRDVFGVYYVLSSNENGRMWFVIEPHGSILAD